MLADGLAQYLIWKQWRKWLLVVGSHPEDAALGEAYERSAKKFGAKIVEKRAFQDTGGGRRSDSGVVQTQRQMPVFTQNAPDYDVLVAADENEVFAGYLPYRTWDPRPVAGSGGLRPTSWDPSHEMWGAVQLQNRFQRMFHRPMNARDNQAWVAMRMIGDAVSRAKTADVKTVRALMLSPDFQIAAFKGEALTLRPVEPAASPADPSDRRTRDGFGIAAGGFSCTRSRNSIRWASISRRPNASSDPSRFNPRRGLALAALSRGRQHLRDDEHALFASAIIAYDPARGMLMRRGG